VKISGSSVYQLAIIGGAAESITVMKSLKPLLTRVAILLSTFSCLAGEDLQKPMLGLKKMNEVEAAAVVKFKAEMSDVKRWFLAYQESCVEKEAWAHQIPVKIYGQLSTVHTDGLPKELSAAFQTLSRDFKKHAELLKDMPKDEVAIMDWMPEKLADEKFAATSAALMEAQSLDFQALIKIAADYGAAAEVDLYEMAEMLDENVDRWIVILGSHSTFEAAKQQAEDLAKKSKVPFTMKGMVYDAEGLHYPKDFEDEVYAGKSISRRGNATIIGEAEVDHFLSVEKSDDYKDFTPGRYIIVGNIAATAEEGARQVEAFKKVAPDAYAKVTKVFIGCDH
jgi:hypothetical protein